MNVASRSSTTDSQLAHAGPESAAATAPVLRHTMHLPQHTPNSLPSMRPSNSSFSALRTGVACSALICLPVLCTAAQAALTPQAGITSQPAAPIQAVAKSMAKPAAKPAAEKAASKNASVKSPAAKSRVARGEKSAAIITQREMSEFPSRIAQRRGSGWINELRALSPRPGDARSTPGTFARITRPEDFAPSVLAAAPVVETSSLSFVASTKNIAPIAKNKTLHAAAYSGKAARLAKVEAKRREAPSAVIWLVNAAPKSPNATDGKVTTGSVPVTGSELFRSKDFPGLDSMGKVIDVKSLHLPPAMMRPLTPEERKVAIDADKPFITLPPAPGTRISQSTPGTNNPARRAQNPDLPPVRQPETPVTSSDRLPNQIEVAVSTFVVLVTTTDLQTVAVADPSIADVAVINSRAALVNGKMPGVTSLVIVDRLKIRQYQVRVTPALGTRAPDIGSAIGLEGVRVRQLRDAVILEGEVQSAEEMKRAVEIAGIYSSRVINQLTLPPAPVIPPPPAVEIVKAAQIQEAINLPRVTVRVVGETALLEGTVDSLEQRQRAETVARAFAKEVVNVIQPPRLTLEQVRESVGAAVNAVAVPDGPVGVVGMTGAPPAVSRITVRQVGDQIILEGLVLTQAEIEQAATIASRSGLQVVNRLQIAPPQVVEALFLNTVAAAIGQPGVRVRGTKERLVLQGTVPDTNAAVAAEQIARGFAQEVDVLLTTPYPILVNVDVSIVEIARTDLRTLGVNFPGLVETATGFPGGQPLGGVTVGEVVGNTTLGSTFAVNLRAMMDKGVAKLLSNPRTTVLSGRTATFQVGGEVPIPVSTTQTATGTTTSIEFKDFGVLVDVIPNATTNGTVTMRVRTEVSQPDFTLGFTPFPGSTTIPAFTKRATVSEVTVPPRGTIALGGLIQSNVNDVVRKVPILGNIPILGKLFQSKRFQRNETELVIFVTPTVLPNPMIDGGEAPAGVAAAGNTTNVSTKLGNPGIESFNTGSAISQGSTGGSGGGGGK